MTFQYWQDVPVCLYVVYLNFIQQKITVELSHLWWPDAVFRFLIPVISSRVMVVDQGRKDPVVCGARSLSRIGYHVFVVVKVVMDHPWVPSIVCQESARLHVVVRSIFQCLMMVSFVTAWFVTAIVHFIYDMSCHQNHISHFSILGPPNCPVKTAAYVQMVSGGVHSRSNSTKAHAWLTLCICLECDSGGSFILLYINMMIWMW